LLVTVLIRERAIIDGQVDALGQIVAHDAQGRQLRIQNGYPWPLQKGVASLV